MVPSLGTIQSSPSRLRGEQLAAEQTLSVTRLCLLRDTHELLTALPLATSVPVCNPMTRKHTKSG